MSCLMVNINARIHNFFCRLILNVQKQACVISARISKALVIFAGLSTSISSNYLTTYSARSRGARSDAATAAPDLMILGTRDFFWVGGE